jgi:hypothetical protein
MMKKKTLERFIFTNNVLSGCLLLSEPALGWGTEPSSGFGAADFPSRHQNFAGSIPVSRRAGS